MSLKWVNSLFVIIYFRDQRTIVKRNEHSDKFFLVALLTFKNDTSDPFSRLRSDMFSSVARLPKIVLRRINNLSLYIVHDL